jgi:hypothetical protein
MSVVEDTRKVLQDFLAHELGAIAVRLDAVEKIVEGNERRAEKRHDELMRKTDSVADTASLREWMARLEERIAPHN